MYYAELLEIVGFSMRFGIAVAVLSALVFVGIMFHFFWIKQCSPHLVAAIAALCNLISGALAGHALTEMTPEQAVSESVAISFFNAISVALIWLIVFEVLRLARPHNAEGTIDHHRTNLIGTYAAYSWTFILVVCDIGFAVALRSVLDDSGSPTYTVDTTVVQIYQFGFFGCWGYVLWAGWQLYLSRSDVAAFFRPLLVYIALAILVTIGRSITAGTPVIYSASTAMSILSADFVLGQLFGLIALVYVTYFAPRWRASTKASVGSPVHNKPESPPAHSTSADKTEVSHDVA